MANNFNTFIDLLHHTFEESNLGVVNVEDIEFTMDLSLEKPMNLGRVELIADINEGHDYSWGNFFSFSLNSIGNASSDE